MAAPTVGAVMADILPYLGVERHYPEDHIASQEIIVDDFTGMTRNETQKLLKTKNLTGRFVGSGETVTGQIPAAGKPVPGGSQVLIYLGGMNRAQAAAAAGELGLYVLMTGNDGISAKVVVTSQKTPAGTEVPTGTTIQLEFTDTGARD